MRSALDALRRPCQQVRRQALPGPRRLVQGSVFSIRYTGSRGPVTRLLHGYTWLPGSAGITLNRHLEKVSLHDTRFLLVLSCLPIRGLEVLKLARIDRQTDQALLSVVPEIERSVYGCKSCWSVLRKHSNDQEAAHDPVGRNGVVGDSRGRRSFSSMAISSKRRRNCVIV